MLTPRTLELAPLRLEQLSRSAAGRDVLAGVLAMAQSAVDHLTRLAAQAKTPRMAVVGRLRGTGRGIHFRDLIAALEREHPIQLKSPFECSNLVAGAAWSGEEILGPQHRGALAKLRWSAGADDLPIHVHDFSDRFIVVESGRGFFHVSDQPFDEFDGSDVRSIPARERDVFLFTRGVMHTFSTIDQPMTLLSVQLPYLEFDDPRQYRVPRKLWTARDNPEPKPPQVGCDPAWTVLARQTAPKSILSEVLTAVPPL